MDLVTENSKDAAFFGEKPPVDKEALVKQFSPFVRSIAQKVKKSISTQVELDDLVSYGMAGLLEAADRFDPRFGANFTTFSYYRVRGAIYDGLRGMGWLSRSEYQKTKQNARALNYLQQQSPRDQSGSGVESSARADVEELTQQVTNLVTIFVTSLDAENDMQIEDMGVERQDGLLERKELREYMKKALAQLLPEDRQVIELYYFKELSLEEVGAKLGLSKSWMSRRHAQVISRLSGILSGLMGESKTKGRATRNKYRPITLSGRA
jgi:RNA polymerase sigma factor for flagellar operon FliA